MTPDYYAEVLAKTKFFRNVTAPDDAIAVAIHCNFGEWSRFDCSAGVMLGAYNHHAGKFTVNAFQVVSNLGCPSADRLLLNLLTHARSTAVAICQLPLNYDGELDALGIID